MSLIEYHGRQTAHHCGYCNTNGSISNGLSSQQITVLEYQDMVNRGWRRAGTYFYKPDIKNSCCKLYTIRCDVAQAQLHRSHKRVIRTFNRWLADGCPERKSKRNTSQNSSNSLAKPDAPQSKQPNTRPAPTAASTTVSSPPPATRAKDSPSRSVESKSWHKRWQNTLSRMRKQLASKCDATELEQAVRVKHSERLAARRAKWAQKCARKSIEQRLGAMPVNSKYKLELRMVRTCPVSAEFKRSAAAEFALYKKYQVAIHHDNESEVSVPGFTRFLVNSPFQSAESLTGDSALGQGSAPCGYGSYHMQWWLVPRVGPTPSAETEASARAGSSDADALAERLICVGVLDVLPHCVSAVYLFYDPSLAHVSLGTYSALREIALTRELTKTLSAELKWYYLGFYIHTCPKMRYKGQYRPAELLCPETFTWWPIERCLPLIEASPYSRFAPELSPSSTFPNKASSTDADSPGARVPLFLYRRRERRLLRDFVSDRECELDAKAARLAAQAKRREAKGKGGSRPGSGSGTGPAATSDRARLSAALFGLSAGTGTGAGDSDETKLELARSRLHDLEDTVNEYARLIGPACASRLIYVVDDDDY